MFPRAQDHRAVAGDRLDLAHHADLGGGRDLDDHLDLFFDDLGHLFFDDLGRARDDDRLLDQSL